MGAVGEGKVRQEVTWTRWCDRRVTRVCVCAQVQDWMKKNLEEKFSPLSSKPDSVKQDMEKLQRQVEPQLPLLVGRTHSSPCWTRAGVSPRRAVPP